MHARHRLKKSVEFQRVRALKQSWAHPLMVLYVAPNRLEVVRAGISVGKRVGKAVVRNRAKRLIREALRSYLPSLPLGRDLVWIARAPMAEADFQQVRQVVELLLRRARLLPQRVQASRESAQTGAADLPLEGKDSDRPSAGGDPGGSGRGADLE